MSDTYHARRRRRRMRDPRFAFWYLLARIRLAKRSRGGD